MGTKMMEEKLLKVKDIDILVYKKDIKNFKKEIGSV